MSFSLSAILLIVYAFYGFLLSAGKDLAQLSILGEVNLVIVMSLFSIFMGVFISGYYSWWSKRAIDPEIKRIREEKKHD
ncbi:DUF485 domain-containing protein [Temperatibacter marinus]